MGGKLRRAGQKTKRATRQGTENKTFFIIVFLQHDRAIPRLTPVPEQEEENLPPSWNDLAPNCYSQLEYNIKSNNCYQIMAKSRKGVETVSNGTPVVVSSWDAHSAPGLLHQAAADPVYLQNQVYQIQFRHVSDTGTSTGHMPDVKMSLYVFNDGEYITSRLRQALGSAVPESSQIQLMLRGVVIRPETKLQSYNIEPQAGVITILYKIIHQKVEAAQRSSPFEEPIGNISTERTRFYPSRQQGGAGGGAAAVVAPPAPGASTSSSSSSSSNFARRDKAGKNFLDDVGNDGGDVDELGEDDDFLGKNNDEDVQMGIRMSPTMITTKELQRTVSRVRHGLLAGIVPKLTVEGSGGTYMMTCLSNGEPLAMFKPGDEEFHAPNNPRDIPSAAGSESARPGVYSTEGVYREVAAFLLDESGYHGVPETTVVHCKHSTFYKASKNRLQNEWKQGSLQMFVHNAEAIENFGPGIFADKEIHKIGILDIRIVNLDRNAGNILVVKKGKEYKCVPIDHGLCLPDRLACCEEEVYWMPVPQAKRPFGPEELEFIKNLDPDADMRILDQNLGLKREVLRLMKCCTLLLQIAAREGLTLYEIGQFMYRQNYDEPSNMEDTIQNAIDATLVSTFGSVSDCRQAGESRNAARGFEALDISMGNHMHQKKKMAQHKNNKPFHHSLDAAELNSQVSDATVSEDYTASNGNNASGNHGNNPVLFPGPRANFPGISRAFEHRSSPANVPGRAGHSTSLGSKAVHPTFDRVNKLGRSVLHWDKQFEERFFRSFKSMVEAFIMQKKAKHASQNSNGEQATISYGKPMQDPFAVVDEDDEEEFTQERDDTEEENVVTAVENNKDDQDDDEDDGDDQDDEDDCSTPGGDESDGSSDKSASRLSGKFW